jgi:hypothetical protein
MKTVRFLQKQSPYNAGEVAGFSDEICERYVNAKVAEIVPCEEPIQDEAVLDAAQWKQKFYDAAAAHKKELHDIVEYLAVVETERDGLKSRVIELEALEDKALRQERQIAELEGLLAEARAQASAKPEGEDAAPAGPVGPDGAPIDVTAKAEGEKPAGNEPAAGADTSANLQPSAANEPAASSGAQEVLGGTEAAPAGSGKKTGRK